MPLEIRELVIKATIKEANDTAGQSEARPDQSSDDREARLVNLCIARVMEILREKAER